MAPSQPLIAKRRSAYGSYPWGIFNTATGQFVEVERRAQGSGAFAGYVAFFKLKRDADLAIQGIVTYAAMTLAAQAPKVTPKETTAYRGYLIRFNPLNGATWIEKDKALIGHAKDEADARRIIDELV